MGEDFHAGLNNKNIIANSGLSTISSAWAGEGELRLQGLPPGSPAAAALP
jgi:hypothetical protein